MVVLDTDVLTVLQYGQSPEAQRVRERLRMTGELDAVSVVTHAEQLSGRLAECARAKSPEQYGVAAHRLRQTVESYQGRTVLDFDDRAATEFRRLKAAKVRIGTMDLRIASVALVHDATLITRNLADYRRVPGLRAEDWTAPARAGAENGGR